MSNRRANHWATLLALITASAACGSDPQQQPPDAALAPDASVDAHTPDSGPPLAVVAKNPNDASEHVSLRASVTVTFDRNIAPATFTAASFSLTDPGGAEVLATIEASGATAVLTPTQPLLRSTTYTAKLTTAVTGLDGVGLAADVTWSFTARARAWGTATTIETSDFDATPGQIAVDAAGNVIAVWIQSDGQHNSVWANRYQPGVGWGVAELVETDNTGAAKNAVVAMDAAGNATVGWLQNDGTRWNAWTRRYVVNVGWGAPALLETDDTADAEHLRVAASSTGEAVALWVQRVALPGPLNIWASHYVPATGWTVPQQIEATPLSLISSPSLAMNATGDVVVAWRRAEGLSAALWATRYTAGAWDTPVRIQPADVAVSLPGVAIDAAGNSVVAWSQVGAGPEGVWTSRYSTTTTSWASPVRIDTSITNDADSVGVFANAGGMIVAVWTGTLSGDTWSSRYDATGGWESPLRLETDPTNDSIFPAVVLDAQGNAIGAWQQWNGIRTDIWSNIRPATASWLMPELIESDDQGRAELVRLVVDPAGNVVAVWRQSDGTRWNIRANRYD